MKHIRTMIVVLVLVLIAGSAFATETIPAFDDKRLNNYDVAAPVAVYTVEYGDALGLDIWAPVGYENAGKLVLRVTAEDVAAVTSSPETATMIASNAELGISLYRLPDGAFQLMANAGESGIYSLVFNEMLNNTGYTSEWLK